MITDNLTTAVYFSDLLPKKCPNLNQHIAEVLEANGIPYAYLSETKDIWCRDFMPIQIAEDRFVSYKYTPNYLQDKTGLRLQTNPEAVLQAQQNRLQSVLQNAITIDLVLDGGNVVKCGNIVVMTEKVFAENRDKSPIEVDRILKDAFQCDVLYLPWDHQETFGHSDGIVHYAGNGRILLTNYDDSSLYYYRRFRKALEKHFEVIPLYYKTKKIHARSWAYINFLQIGKLILVPQLELEEDEQALEQISNAMPDCEVLGIPALEAVRRGGGLNCISWNTTTLQDDIFEESIIGQTNIPHGYKSAYEKPLPTKPPLSRLFHSHCPTNQENTFKLSASVLNIYSGCHCMAQTKRLPTIFTASMRPSGDSAMEIKSLPRSLMAW
jgi:agmatine/peptidylarginine deiminase